MEDHVVNAIAEDIVTEEIQEENIVETAEEAGTLDDALDVVYNEGDGATIVPDVVAEVEEAVETENPVVDPLPAEDTMTAEEIQGETAEPLAETDAETVEDIQEEAEPETEPEDTPVIEEAVIPSYIRHAQEIGTVEAPIIAPDGRETFIPTLLRND
jgi:hypothetical protein